MDDLRIIELKSENVKKIKAISIKPDGSTVLITGKNGQGKSSVLDSILYALGGGNALPDKPIREGEERAEINMDLGEYRIRRLFKGEKNYLEVFSKDGAKFTSPQALLDKIVGKLSFDPMTFLSTPEKEQRVILLDLLGVSVDELDAKRKSIYDSRTVVNRAVTELKGKASGLRFDPKLQSEEKSAKDILDAIQIERAKESTKTDMTNKLKSYRSKVEDYEATLADLREKTLDIEDSIEQGEALIRGLHDKIASTEVADVTGLEKELSEIEETNKAIRANNQAREIQLELGEEQGRKDDLDKEINAVDKEKKKLLDDVKMPIEGLSFDSESVSYNGIPLKQVNSADQFKVCLAMGMALNPKLKVILFKNGSLLDSDSLKYVSDLATEGGYQVWIEKVDETGKVGIVIEDGEIKP